MEFDVDEIKEKGHVEKDAALSPLQVIGNQIDLIKFSKPILVKVIAQLTAADILVTGSANTVGILNCDRCLIDFEQEISGEFAQTFSLDLERIDITNEIRETIILDIPMKSVCREDCLGLCPACGINKNHKKCKCAVKIIPEGSHFKTFPFKN